MTEKQIQLKIIRDELNDSLQIKINLLINKNKNNLLSAKA